MDSGKQITQYLEELAQELTDLQVTIPFHMLITGGAYMLLQQQRKSTLDIDFTLLDISQHKIQPNTVFPITIRKKEISGKKSTVPYSAEFKQAVEMVAVRHKNLDDDWMNDEAAVYLYDDAPHAEVMFWQSFGEIIYVYLPTMEYVFATKIAAYRPKDAEDIQILTRALNIQTWEQAKAIIDKFLLPDAQTFWEVGEKLEDLFP
ncbi:MAG: hypothetical protein ABI234_12140 [Ktedonobacteraceae bacterium]